MRRVLSVAVLAFLCAAAAARAGERTLAFVDAAGRAQVEVTVRLPGDVTRAHFSAIRFGTGTASPIGLPAADRSNVGGELQPAAEIEQLPQGSARGAREGDVDWSGATLWIRPLAITNCYIRYASVSGYVRGGETFTQVPAYWTSVGTMTYNVGAGRVYTRVYNPSGTLQCDTTATYTLEPCVSIASDCQQGAFTVQLTGKKRQKNSFYLFFYLVQDV